MPELMSHVYEWFINLTNTRRNYGWGVTPLTYTEIYCWSKLRGIELDDWELDTLLTLDRVYISVEADAAAKRRK